MADNIVTHCKTCGTSWGDCEILDDKECAACLRKEVERLRADIDSVVLCRMCYKPDAACQCTHDTTDSWMTLRETMDFMDDEVERLRLVVSAWEESAQHGHPSPCNMGPLCPYCEIERLRARVVDGIEAWACPACGGALVFVTRPLCQCLSWPQKGTPYPVIPQPPGAPPCDD